MISTGFPLGNAMLSAFMAFRALQVYLQMTQHRKKASYEDYRLLGKVQSLNAYVLYAIMTMTCMFMYV